MSYRDRLTRNSALARTLIACALSLPVAGQDAGGTSPEPKSWDLSLCMSTGEPVLVKREIAGKGEMLVTLGGKSNRVKMSWDDEFSFVDQFQLIDDENKHYECTRRYVKSVSDVNGKPTDSCINGLTAKFVTEDGRINISIADDRRLPNSVLTRLLDEGACVGPWVALPEAAKVGDSFEVDARSLFATLMRPDGAITIGKSEFTFVSVEQEGSLACLTAEVLWTDTQESEDGEGTVRLDHRDDVVLRVDLQAHRMHSLSMKGSLSGEGPGPDGTSIELTAEYECELTTRIGAAAEKALKARPAFRLVSKSVTALGIEFDLPSSWAKLDPEDDEFYFQRTVAPGSAVIVVSTVALGDVAIGDIMKATVKELKKDGYSPKAKKAKSRLAKGFSIEVESEGTVYHTGYFKLDSRRWVTFKLAGDSEGFKAAWKDYEKARKSLDRG